MQKIITLLSLLLISISCAHQPKQPKFTHQVTTYRHWQAQYREPSSFWDIFKGPKKIFTPLTGEEKNQFPSLVEESLVWREKAFLFYSILTKYRFNKPLTENEKLYLTSLQFSHNIKKGKNKKRPYNSFLIKQLHRSFSEYQRIFNKIVKVVRAGDWVFRKNYNIFISTEFPTGEDKEAWHKWTREEIFGEHDEDEEFVQPFYINPLDAKGIELIKRIKRSMAARLLFFDNFNYAVHFYQDDHLLRQLVNFDHEETERILTKVATYFHSFSVFRQLGESIDLYNSVKEFHAKQQLEISPFEKMLNNVIESSQMFQIFDQISTFSLIKEKFNFYGQQISLNLAQARDNTTYSLSKVFGNFVGGVVKREGKLLALPEQTKKEILDKLRPLDILMEKAPFRLSDKFIPGHFGHIAIWTGTEQELKELGIWNTPEVKPFQKYIRAGHHIIEALRPGVQLNTFNHFLDIDDLAIVRFREHFSKAQARRYLLNAFAQIGKDYDFNFDVETDKTIVCSELAYVTFDDMQWPTSKIVGRFTISPDNVALMTGPNKRLKLIYLIHDGKVSSSKDQEKLFEKLMEKSVKEMKKEQAEIE